MYDLKACAVCFSTDSKLYSLDSEPLRRVFHLISGVQTSRGSGLPNYLCFQCLACLKSSKKFRDKCQRAHYTLQQILKNNKEVTITNLTDFNRDLLEIMPPLSYMSLDKAHYEQTKFQWTMNNQLSESNMSKVKSVPILHCSTLTVDDTFTTITALHDKDNDNKNNIEETVNEIVDSNFGIGKEQYLAQTSNELADSIMDDNNFASDNEPEESTEDNTLCKVVKTESIVDGSNLDKEYAMMIPISVKEAKATIEVYKFFSHGKYHCETCNKAFYNKKRLKLHMRMHDKHVSGYYHCGICNYYYKTEFLLKTHMTEKHMYKYVCRKCPEVCFDRRSAKQHFIWTHLQKGSNKDANWYESRPSWLSTKGCKRAKGEVTLKPVRKIKKVPEDFPVYEPIRHEEQYTLVQQRQHTKNYKESRYQCNLCYRGFRLMVTFTKHMKKHDPLHSGPLQCDVCKLHFKDQRKLYMHMNIMHLFKYSCQTCNYVCYKRSQAQMHYRWHKKVTYQCPHCKMEFMSNSTRLTHIRVKHPSMNICNLCGHSFVSENGLYCHKQMAHTKEEIVLSSSMSVNKTDPAYCADCDIQFLNETAFTTHLGSSNKHTTTNVSSKPNRRGENESGRKPRGRSRRRACSEIVNNGVATCTTCEICNIKLVNDVQARKHYDSEHPDTEFLKRYMCDVCGHTTRVYANLIVHMRTHTKEKPYGCPHCDRRFNMPSNRDRHLVVHTGEKRHQCQHCNRRFAQRITCKLHIQTVHHKIPYAPWNKKNRRRRKALETASIQATSMLPTTPHKLTFETPGDYLNAYITYNDE